ncbi:MAG TPA: hypothetical protein VI796_02940 [Candidatus Thermoplasmatota archaeon]|nr:hypothetical protein [Candidatus Thermoplasmatota archaeon]
MTKILSALALPGLLLVVATFVLASSGYAASPSPGSGDPVVSGAFTTPLPPPSTPGPSPTPPGVPGTTTTASPTATTASHPDPGFEVVALVAALGLTLFAFRRRL